MDLDWESIVHGEFPAVESGYDPAAVEAHLIAVAEAVRELAAPQASIANDVSQQVQTIVAAAEATAAEIREQTAARAAEIEREVREQTAKRAAEIENEVRENITRATQEEAAQARHDAAQVSAASRTIIGGLDKLGLDFTDILRELRERANAIRDAMQEIEGIVSEEFDLKPLPHDRPGPSWAPTPQAEPAQEPEQATPPVIEPEFESETEWEPEDEEEDEWDTEPQADAAPEPERERLPPAPVLESFEEEEPERERLPPAPALEEAEDEDEPEPADEEPQLLFEDAAIEYEPAIETEQEPAAAEPVHLDDPGVIEDARIIALDMALSGHSREDIGEYVSSNFDVPDPAALVDEVLASVED